MKGSSKKALPILLAAAAVAVLLAVMLRSREPSYRGRRLSHWIESCGEASARFDTAASNEAVIAIQKIGTNAIPWLLRDLCAEDSEFKRSLIVWARDHSWIHIRPRMASDRQV